MIMKKKVWCLRYALDYPYKPIAGKWILNAACWSENPWHAKLYESWEHAYQTIEYFYEEYLLRNSNPVSIEEYAKRYDIFEAELQLNIMVNDE